MGIIWILGSCAVGFVAGRSPQDGTKGREVMKSVVRTGYKAGRAVQTAFAEVREELSDLIAEAKAELDKPGAHGDSMDEPWPQRERHQLDSKPASS
jgi:hypothetical protein